MHALEPCRTVALRLTFSGVRRRAPCPGPRGAIVTILTHVLADMTTNVQHIHPARAEMLRVASRHPAARPDRSACAVLCPCRWCLRADGPCATSSSYQPDLPGAANVSVRLTFTSFASLGRICLSACATFAVVCACVPRGIMGMVGYGSPSLVSV